MQTRFTREDAKNVWDAVNQLKKRQDVACMYNITPEEVDMLWRTGRRIWGKNVKVNIGRQKSLVEMQPVCKRPKAVYSNKKHG